MLSNGGIDSLQKLEFSRSKTLKSAQSAHFSSFHTKNQSSKRANPQGESLSEVGMKQESSSTIGAGFHKRRFLQNIEKLRQKYDKRKSLEVNNGYTDMNVKRERLKQGRSLEQMPLNFQRQNREPVTQQNSREELERGCQRRSSRLRYQELLPLNKISQINESVMASKKGVRFKYDTTENETGVKYQFDLDQQNNSEPSYQPTESVTFSEGCLIPNVVQAYSYEVSFTQSTESEGLQEGNFTTQRNEVLLAVFDSSRRPMESPLELLLDNVGEIESRIILISSIITPLRATFLDNESVAWFIVEGVIDCVFTLDIIFSFFSAYYNKIEELISTHREIACGYLKTWFIIDILSILPLQFIFKSNGNSFGKLARLPRIYQIIKTTKFVNLLKTVKTKARMKRQMKKVSTQNMELQKLIMFFFLFAIMCHNLSCLWFLVAKLQDFNESTWVFKYEYDIASVPEQYLASLYFIVTTITTVGYGDITSKNPAEQAFCIILMIIGVIAYSMAISSFTNIMSAYNLKQKLLVQKLNVLSHLRDEYNLSFEFYWRLRQSLHYEHTMDMSEKLQFVQQLPPKLNIELSNIMYTHQLADIKFFQSKPPKFIASIAPKLKPLKVCKGDYIFLKGDSLDGIYFIQKGEAAFVERRQRADLIFATNKAGSYFGEIDFISLNESVSPRRMFTVKAKTDMDLLFLDQDDLYSIDNEFKKEMLSLFNNAFQHLDKLKSMNKRSKKWLQRRYTNFSKEQNQMSDQEKSSFVSSILTNRKLQKVSTVKINTLEKKETGSLQYFQPSSPMHQRITEGRNSIRRSFVLQKQEYLDKIERKKRSNSCFKREESKDNIKITLNEGRGSLNLPSTVRKNKTLLISRIEEPLELFHSTSASHRNRALNPDSDSDSIAQSTQRYFLESGRK